eukprot:Tbor_TRINITY_DN5016_c0_g2::TRINITY_DN5016_c0_g2_i2::g.14346::m.14346/K19176/FAAH2; fatty acid amide hydrolase 2
MILPLISVPLLVAIFVGFLGPLLLFAWWHRFTIRNTPFIPPIPLLEAPSPIIKMSATQLCRKLRSGDLTSVQVTKAFISHIEKINPYINAMVCNRFEAALEEAERADRILLRIHNATEKGQLVLTRDGTLFDIDLVDRTYTDQEADRLVKAARKSNKVSSFCDPGWLLGIPCCVKECMFVDGMPCASGMAKRMNYISECNSPVVQNVRDSGAIVLGVTNTSELCMWMESSNQVYGISRNPYDVTRIVGGSSGGEGAALGAMFAPFGIGSDIGGSIRMPAFFNGIFGHKPSSILVPNAGQHPTVTDSGHHLMSTGPMCSHAEDLLPLLRVMARGGPLVCNEEYRHAPYPPTQLLFPKKCSIASSQKGGATSVNWRLRGANGKPLRVYAIEDLGLFNIRVTNKQKNVIRDSANRLAKLPGVESVTLLNLRDKRQNLVYNNRGAGGSTTEVASLPKGWENMHYAMDIWSAKVSKISPSFTDNMNNSYDAPINPYKELLYLLLGKPSHTLAAILLMMLEQVMTLMPQMYYTKSYKRASDLMASVTATLGDDAVIIVPTYPEPAQKHHQPKWFPFRFQYTALFNAISTPATAVPIWLPDDSEETVATDIRRGNVKQQDRGTAPFQLLPVNSREERLTAHMPH